jgi:hypothetical protein
MGSDQITDVSVIAPTYVAETQGEALGELPSSNEIRWGMRRKSQLIDAIRGGLLTFEEAQARYRLTVEELASWQAFFETHGQRGLRTTLTQQYRYLRR